MSRPKPKHKQMELTEDLRELIQETADATLRAAMNSMIPAQQLGYYKIMERLLTNYKRLQRLVANEQEYIDAVELRMRSTDIRTHTSKPGGGPIADPDEAIEQQRKRSYQRTLAQFQDIERVVKLFEQREEFVVIRMYYFNETVEGVDRGSLPHLSWVEIAEELSSRDILRMEKTARRWRNNMINDMAVCMFGSAAAVSESMYWMGAETTQPRAAEFDSYP